MKYGLVVLVLEDVTAELPYPTTRVIELLQYVVTGAQVQWGWVVQVHL